MLKTSLAPSHPGWQRLEYRSGNFRENGIGVGSCRTELPSAKDSVVGSCSAVVLNIPMTQVLSATIRFSSDTSLETMVGVAGQRWRIEECFQFACISTWFGITKFAPGRAGIATSLWSWLQEPLVCVALSAEPLGELQLLHFSSGRGWLWLRSKRSVGSSAQSRQLRRWLWSFIPAPGL